MVKPRTYYLDDGSTTNIVEVMERTGLKYSGAVNRLRMYTSPALVFLPRKKSGPLAFRVSSSDWVSKPDKVCGGIPYECSYMDGAVDEISGFVKDRYGNILETWEKRALEKFRAKQRQQWLNDKRKKND